MSSSSDRTAEIWSTRLQRELLALTSDGAGDDKDAVGVIPPFIKVQEHELVIENGVCKVTFRIEVGEDQMAPKKEEGGEAEKEGEESEKGGDADKAEGESGDKADEGADAEAAVAAALSEPAYVALTLDASLARTLDGKVVASPSSYPFQAPGAFLVSGAAYFPEGSEIDDGDRVDIDLDWTPSLHLNDAVLHVALRVRESIRRGEPFSRAASEEEEGKDDIRDKVDESVQVAKERLGNFWGSFKANANKMAAAIDDAVAPRPSPHSSTAGGAAAAAAPEVARASLSTAAAARAPGAFAGNTAKTKRETGPKTSGRTSSVAIGDDLQLAEAPWNVCSGMYTCKAIRRPVFMEDTMEAARRGREQQVRNSGVFGDGEDDDPVVPYGPRNYMALQSGSIRKVAGAGVTGAGSLFKSFTASAKSVLEESLLMITEELIVEMRTNKFTLGTGTGGYSYGGPVNHMHRIFNFFPYLIFHVISP
uniref:Uncharacterized protein n=1 Tax=Odontella aurita TaxID=265563 RepID=A0A6U6D7W0_9STRA|mmetsp:Transcript_19153/g.55698  ORF Transcript_19153/g.55698 Transcript_19153/m.55698 type:complete len:478 (+) Transcript_19153:268-1701(+)